MSDPCRQTCCKFVDDVEFYAEDAGRSDQEFLVRIIEAAVKAGATVVNIPDTMGYNMPWDFGARIRDLRGRCGCGRSACGRRDGVSRVRD